MKCGFNLGGIFLINLNVLCTFVLHFHPLRRNCEVSVCLFIVAFECSLTKLPCNGMGRYYEYIQEKLTSFKNLSFNNYILIIDVYGCDF